MENVWRTLTSAGISTSRLPGIKLLVLMNALHFVETDVIVVFYSKRKKKKKKLTVQCV